MLRPLRLLPLVTEAVDRSCASQRRTLSANEGCHTLCAGYLAHATQQTPEQSDSFNILGVQTTDHLHAEHG